MPAYVASLAEKGIAKPPSFLAANTMYECIMGSMAYGCNEPGKSDMDLYGFCVPPKTLVFPTLAGEIPGFGKQIQRFEQYHAVKLILECEQILTEGDLDLQRHSELLKDIRRGNWKEEQVREWFQTKEKSLEPLYHESKIIPYSPDEGAIKALLLECLEEHYGSPQNAVVTESAAVQAIRDIARIVERVKT